MKIFLFLDKCLKTLDLDAAEFSDGLWSLEKLSNEDKAVSSNLAFIKGKSSLHKILVLNIGIVIQKVVKTPNIQSTEVLLKKNKALTQYALFNIPQFIRKKLNITLLGSRVY